MPRGEQVLLEESGVRVSSSRIVVGSTTYSMANVTSVEMKEESRSGWLIVGIIGAVLMVPACGIATQGAARELPGAFIFGAISIAVLFVASKLPRADYFAHVTTSAGQVRLSPSTDRNSVARFVAAINDAMIARDSRDEPQEKAPSAHATTVVEKTNTIERQVLVMRCPFCKKLTPADLEACKECGATM